MIRDHIVFTCQDTRLKERLLRESNLSLAKAIAICRAAEATREQIKTLNADQRQMQIASPSNVCTVQRLDKKKRFNNQPTASAHNNSRSSCRNCGRSHASGECRAKNVECRACRKLGHFEKCCITTGRQPRPPQSRSNSVHRHQRAVHEVSEQPSPVQPFDDIYINSVQVHSTTIKTC